MLPLELIQSDERKQGRHIMKILVLDRADMDRVITMEQAVDAAREAFITYSTGVNDIPLRSSIQVSHWNGNALFMPGFVPDSDALGLKIVSVYPDNSEKGIPAVPSTMILLDSKTGQVSAILDGTHLTALRTGAMAGAATAALARKEAEKMVLIGAGGQAKSQLEAVLSVRDIKEVQVFSRHLDRARVFADKHDHYPGVKVRAGEDLDRAVSEADILTAVTTSRSPVFDGSRVKAGAHINGMGSFTPEMAEVPEEVLQRAGRIYLDSFDCLTECGDLRQPIQSGAFEEARITGEIGELLAGRKPGRDHAEQITFFAATGNAILDIVTAKKIYDQAIERNIGRWIEL